MCLTHGPRTVADVPRLSYATLIADDITGLAGFYEQLFGLEVDPADVTDIFRGIDIGQGTTLTFSAPPVYELLGMEAWAEPSGTRTYLTYELDDDAAVDEHVARAVALGAQILRTPYVT